MQHAEIARQGHKYALGEAEVIALQTGYVVSVRPIVDEPYPLGAQITVKASWLKPLPMRYFHGQTPK